MKRPLFFLLLLLSGVGAAQAGMVGGDAAWAERAETLDGELAEPGRIGDSIREYHAAIAADPASIAARWKLLRALHYAADFTSLPEATKDSHVRKAVKLAEESAARVASGSESDRAHLLFWCAIAWGMRAQRVGLFTIVREGVAWRMHDYAERSLALDPNVDGGGALRLLARLHATLPRVPFVSGWVDRERAVALADRGYRRDPDHPGNRLVLALTLLDLDPKRHSEARALLERVGALEPRPAYLVEDLAIRKQARETLESLGN